MTRRHSELERVHRELGAELDDWNGMDVAWTYATDPRDEHDAVRDAAGLFDMSGLKKVWVSGPDARATVDHVITRDMTKLQKGRSIYGLVLNDQGAICDDAMVFHVDDDRFLFVHGSGLAMDRLYESAADRSVELRFDDELHDISLQGPKALALLESETPMELRKLEYLHHQETTVFGKKTLLSRTGCTGERGYEIFCDRADTEAIWNAILERGKKDGVLPCSFTCVGKVRVEAGLLFYPYDMDERHSPWEVDLGWALARSGEYRGKVTAFAARGKERTLIAGLSGDYDDAFPGDSRLLKNGEEVGHITSPSHSHRLKKSLAFAHLQPDLAVPGTELTLTSEALEQPVKVESIPVYDPKRKRLHEVN